MRACARRTLASLRTRARPPFRPRAAGRGGGEAGAGAFADEVALELAEGAEEVEGQAAAGGRRVDGFGDGLEAHAACLKVGDGLDQVRQGAPEPVELPDDEHVAVTEEGQRVSEAWPLGASARGLVLEDRRAAGGGEGVALQGGVLIAGADAGVTDAGHGRVRSGVRKSSCP